MEKPQAPVCAAIDVGSNTIHIVVASCTPTTLEVLADELEMVRIGESVTASRQISPAKMELALSTLKHYHTLAKKLGAQRVLVVATEAIRQAENRAEFCARVKAETGLEVQLISGTVEAALTFLGATYELGPQSEVGVIDLGGGSMELVLARHGQISWRTSVPLGSGWLRDNYLQSDPAPFSEVKTATSFLKASLRSMRLRPSSAPWLITGGSANSLILLARKLFHLPQDAHQLTPALLDRCQGLLSALTSEDISALTDLPIARARVLLAGTLIIKNTMRRLKLDEMMVSRQGIREGLLLTYARWGEGWLAEMNGEDGDGKQGEPFAQSARRSLLARLKTLRESGVEVKKNEEREAVHRMRVASRRLRAALDAYQVCCEPKTFAAVYKQVKQAANALGGARDADVMLEHLVSEMPDLNGEEKAGASWLVGRLQRYREHQQQHLDDFLHTFDGEELERQLKASVRERSGN